VTARAIKWIASLKLTVAALVLIAAACASGTLVVQRLSTEEYVELYGALGARAVSALRLADVYHSAWFAALLGVFCANLVACSVSRLLKPGRSRWFLVTHASVVVIIAGTCVDLLWQVQGLAVLKPGRSVDEMLVDSYVRGDDGSLGWTRRPVKLPFTMELKDFRAEPNAPRIQIAAHGEEGTVVTLNADEAVRVPGTEVDVRLVKLLADVQEGREVCKRDTPGAEPFGPAVNVELEAEEGRWRGWLAPRDPGRYQVFLPEIGIAMRAFEIPPGEAEADALQVLLKMAAQPTLAFILDQVAWEAPARNGNSLRLGKSAYQVNIHEVRADYKNPESLTPANPAACYSVTGPQGEGPLRWVFALYPDFDSTHGGQVACPEVRAEFRALSENAAWFLLGGREPVCIGRTGGREPGRMEPGEDGRIALPGMGAAIRLQTYEREITMRRGFFRMTGMQVLRTAALQLEVGGPNGKSKVWLRSWGAKPVHVAGLSMAIAPGWPSVRQYSSDVALRSEDGTERVGTVSVNDPLGVAGYSLFQSGYDQERGEYSIIQVVREPGLPIVYAGFALLCLGVTVSMLRRFARFGSRDAAEGNPR